MPVEIRQGCKQMLSEAVDQVDEVSAAAIAQTPGDPSIVIINVHDQN